MPRWRSATAPTNCPAGGVQTGAAGRGGPDCRPAAPLFSIVSRLTSQKGSTSCSAAPPPAARGRPARRARHRRPGPRPLCARRRTRTGRIAVRIGYDEAYARTGSSRRRRRSRAVARLEACGLTQLYGLRVTARCRWCAASAVWPTRSSTHAKSGGRPGSCSTRFIPTRWPPRRAVGGAVPHPGGLARADAARDGAGLPGPRRRTPTWPLYADLVAAHARPGS